MQSTLYARIYLYRLFKSFDIIPFSTSSSYSPSSVSYFILTRSMVLTFYYIINFKLRKLNDTQQLLDY
jgi:hypothetical protein